LSGDRQWVITTVITFPVIHPAFFTLPLFFKTEGYGFVEFLKVKPDKSPSPPG